MRLETVELLTRDRDLIKRHIFFLAAERDSLNAKNNLTADEQLRLNSLAPRIADSIKYLADVETRLLKAIPELDSRIKQLENNFFSTLLYERYVLLKSIKTVAKSLGITLTAAYAMHTQAREAYNLLYEITPYKDPRGRKKGNPHFN